MLSLLSFLFALTPAFASDCPNFSGNYLSQDEDIDIVLELKQEGCESAHGHYDYGNGGYINERKMIFDGIKRPLDTDTSYLWLEGFRWEGSEILVENEYRSHVSNTVMYSKGRIFLDAEKNLHEETVWFDQDWKETQRSSYFYQRKP